MKRLTKNEIVIDSGALLEYLKLIIDSSNNQLNGVKRDRLVQYLELFKSRKLVIVPQVLAEIYFLLKRDAKDSNTQLKFWLEIIENPHLNGLQEYYVQKLEIMKNKKHLEFGFTDIALIKVLNQNNFLLSNDYGLVQLCRAFQGLDAYHVEEILD